MIVFILLFTHFQMPWNYFAVPIFGKKDIIQFVSEARVKVEEPEKYNTLK